jgi:shikimate dehydrogenase
MSHPDLIAPEDGEHHARVALFGFPVGHSVSPAMHHSAARHLGLALRYDALLTAPEDLPVAVGQLRDAVWLGANVTVPHKQAASRLVDVLAPTAAAIGAVNTIYKQGDRLIGDNTDVGAVERTLTEHLHLDPESDTVLLLGAGGAARASLAALANLGARRVRIWNRTRQSAEAMLEELRAHRVMREQAMDIAVMPDLATNLDTISVLMNATSVGLDGQSLPVDPRALAGARVFDLVYGVDGTPLVQAALARGLVALDGLWMLVYQAAAAFALWTGERPPEAVMYAAARDVLAERRRMQSAQRGEGVHAKQ